MNYYKEWNYSNLPSVKEIFDAYKKSDTVEFLGSQIHISDKENVFWAIRRKNYLLAEHSDIVENLNRKDQTSRAIAKEIYQEFNRPQNAQISYRSSCLPSYILEIQREVSKDAISINCPTVDDNYIEGVVDKLNLFKALRIAVYRNAMSKAMLASIINEIRTESTTDNGSGDDSSYPNNLGDIQETKSGLTDSDYDALIANIRQALVEGISNFAVLLWPLLFPKDNMLDIIPRFSSALVSKEKRADQAFAILNNAVALDIDQENRRSLVQQVIDLNPVDSSYYLNIIDMFPEEFDSVCSAVTYFAVAIRVDSVLKTYTRLKKHSFAEVEAFIQKVSEYFRLPESELQSLRDSFRADAVRNISNTIDSFKLNAETNVDELASMFSSVEAEATENSITLHQQISAYKP